MKASPGYVFVLLLICESTSCLVVVDTSAFSLMLDVCEEACAQTAGQRTKLPLPPSAAQRDTIENENKQGTLHLRGCSAACIHSASSLMIESGSLSVALSHDETAGGIASSVISTIYATVAIKL